MFISKILNNKRLIVIFCLSLIIFLTTLIVYLFFNTKGIILKNNLTCNFREEVYLKDFIYKLDGTLKNNYRIDTSVVGKKSVKAIFKDKHGFYKVKTFEIEIKDKTPPTILVSDSYTVNVGHETLLEDSLLCADDYDDKVKCKITGSYNFSKVGSYPLTISASDNSGNTTTKEFVLNVIEDNGNISNNEDEKESFVDYREIYKKYKNDNTKIGVDISKWQRGIDFHKLKESGVEFVVLKIAGQKEIDGEIIMDPNFEVNIRNALAENLDVGLYFYSYAKTEKEAKRQADYIIKNIKDYKIELPIVFDWENWEEYNSFEISFNSLNKVAKAFIKRVEDKGYEGSLYSSQYYLENIWFSDDYDRVWVANYGNLTYKGKYNMWQLCSDGRVDGIDTYVDIDVMYLNN